MKNFIKVLLFLTGFLVIWMFFFDSYSFLNLKIFNIMITFSLIFFGFIIFLENRSPSQTVSWFVIFAGFPVVGFLFYLLLGRNFRKEYKFRNKYFEDQYCSEKLAALFVSNEEQVGVIERNENQKFRNLALRIGQTPILTCSRTTVLTNGERTFAEIKCAIENAKHHVHMEYYIFRDDILGNEIMNILVEKAKSGVEVRILLDAVGSWKLSKKYINELLSQGLKITLFNPVRIPVLNSKINFRNHRKIIIVDGEIGFIGGLNVGDEYLGKHEYYGFWRDTHLKVEGKSVISLQHIFIQDWHFMNKDENIELTSYLAPEYELNNECNGEVQIVSGGPDNRYSVLKDLFFAMITSAKKSIWIASPYFIPDEDIFSALKIAAMSGVDVRLLLPSIPDKKTVFYASRSYLPDLLTAGVKVYEYHKGFMHSKLIIVDDDMASVGTANMDMRSFHLNFEVNAFLYQTDSVVDLCSDFILDMKHSKEICHEEFSQRKVTMKVFESLTRLLSPFL